VLRTFHRVLTPSFSGSEVQTALAGLYNSCLQSSSFPARKTRNQHINPHVAHLRGAIMVGVTFVFVNVNVSWRIEFTPW
jgi:hypothetical protein